MCIDPHADNRGGQRACASPKITAMHTPTPPPNTDTMQQYADLGRLTLGNHLVPGPVPMPPSDTKTHRILLDSHLD